MPERPIDLSKFDNNDQLDIHNLQTPEEEKEDELPFDPERDITEKDWDEIKKELEIIRTDLRTKPKTTDGDLMKLCRYMSLMKIINPNVELKLTDQDIEIMTKVVNGFFMIGKLDYAADFTYAVKNINPNMDLRLINENKKKIKEFLENDLLETQMRSEKFEWTNFLLAKTTRAKIFDSSINTEFSEQNKIFISKMLEEYRKNCEWNNFSIEAMGTKIIDPYIDLSLDKIAWDGMNSLLKEKRNNKNWYSYLHIASNMKILAAKEVKVTDKGLEIIMPERKPKLDATPPLPERKEF